MGLTANQLKSITDEAKKIRTAAGKKTIEVYNMPWRKAVKEAAKKLNISNKPQGKKK